MFPEGASNRHVVLLSGGIDSATLMRSLAASGIPIEALHIDYGQPALIREAQSATALAHDSGIQLSRVQIGGLSITGGTEIAGRNALLVIVGLMHLAGSPGVLYLGIHAGTGYADCSPAFIRLQQTVLDLYTKGTVQLSAPFRDATKADIWQLARDLGVPLSVTYSCELGYEQPCGQCRSCADLESLNAGH